MFLKIFSVGMPFNFQRFGRQLGKLCRAVSSTSKPQEAEHAVSAFAGPKEKGTPHLQGCRPPARAALLHSSAPPVLICPVPVRSVANRVLRLEVAEGRHPGRQRQEKKRIPRKESVCADLQRIGREPGHPLNAAFICRLGICSRFRFFRRRCR